MRWEGGTYSDTTEISSDHFKVTKPASGTNGSLKFVTLGAAIAGAPIPDKLHIKVADRLELTVAVTQKLDVVEDILTVNDQTGSIDSPIDTLIYHENHYSDKFIVSTGDNAVLWNAFPTIDYEYLSFEGAGTNNGFFRTKFTTDFTREARTGIIRVERSKGNSDPVYVRVTHEGTPLLNTIVLPEIHEGFPKVTQMIATGMSSHPKLYRWTAMLTDVEQTTSPIDDSLDPQKELTLGVSTTSAGTILNPSPTPHLVTGTGGEYLVITFAAKNPQFPVHWSGNLTVRYERNSSTHPLSKTHKTTILTANSDLGRPGDYVPRGSDRTNAEYVIFSVNPTRLITLGTTWGTHSEAIEYCASRHARLFSRREFPTNNTNIGYNLFLPIHYWNVSHGLADLLSNLINPATGVTVSGEHATPIQTSILSTTIPPLHPASGHLMATHETRQSIFQVQDNWGEKQERKYLIRCIKE
jgi:hypothetical protein